MYIFIDIQQPRTFTEHLRVYGMVQGLRNVLVYGLWAHVVTDDTAIEAVMEPGNVTVLPCK